MNYVQCWIGKTIDEKRKSYLTNFVKSINFTKDTYTLISEYQILTNKNIKYVDYQTYVDEMLKDELIKQVWECISGDTVNSLKSDVIRFHYLSNNPNTIYADIDVVKVKNPTLQDQLYLYPYTSNRLDVCVMYNGTNIKRIREIMLGIFNRVYNPKLNKFYPERIWVFAYINKYLQGTKSIPGFKHVGMGGK